MKGAQGGMQALMKQANQMQAKMKKMQEELKTREFEGTAGGGAVKVKVNGEYMVTNLEIDPEALKDDPEMVQDLFIAATNEAIKTAKETSNKEMEKITGGVALPGLF